ncbi:uncharacterized protein BXIN_2429 [Babesia sp. Xinjiang]|uniref:uncharacterized protein n=1 Tax=Babesia sp. Xinjiang TaxID=462227 RepID=UPI000A239284|nr:uncharacterized protein BXIN_2429 [Babesia sp. Xinjiang]ORM41381.1 hypothetical protein BXIN_2429 [Babesia sp. Xinjiang]
MSNGGCSCNGGTGPHNKVTCPPGNLKECIDWILRVTNKDDTKNGDQNGKELGEAVVKLLEGATKYLDSLTNGNNGGATEKLTKDKDVLQAVNGNGQLITKLADNLQKFIGYNNGGGTLTGNGIGNQGTSGGAGQKYTSTYTGDWNSVGNEQNKQLCARIFLGTIPVMFSGLSYLYWQCNTGNGRGDTRWSTHQINKPPLGIYLVCSGYDSKQLNQKGSGSGGKNITGTEVAKLLKELFSDNNGATKVSNPYPEYINEVLKNTNTTSPDTHPLSSLYLASQYYFQYKFHPGSPNRVPCSIREMLYWLMALPYSGCFPLAPEVIKKSIDKITENADISGGEHGGIIPFKDVTLKSSDPLDCLISTSCHYAAVVLSTMQGKLSSPKTSTTTTDTPLGNPTNIHDIYSNTAFNFEYPTTAGALFPVLWDIIYCLLSQLYFLRRLCQFKLGTGCGWLYCKYGKDVKYDNLKSWICTVTPGETHSSGSGGNTCTESQQHINNCGQSHASPSPLQAFLCDYLTPFQCESLKNKECHMKNGQLVSTNGVTTVPYSDHVSHRNFNQYCPVPMGFNKELLPQNGRTGHYIYEILDYFTQDDRNYVSLYNITLCLLIVCKRTPRTVGDLFGFFLYLDENMETAINTESMKIPWSNGSNSITTAVENLGKDHDEDSDDASHPANLNTLRYSDCDTTGVTCGKYLDPLSFLIYCNVSVAFAMSYLSRIVYLTDVLKDGLKQLQKDFQKLKCKHHNNKSCNAGCHESNSCQCPTIVECSEVLGLLYSYGLHYYYPEVLHSGTGEDPEQKRQCNDFSTQLNAVITGNLFDDLLKEINKFLTCIRKPFLYYLLTFWLIAILYFSYGLTIPLDLLHIRSHLRPALSHQISVLALLSHKAMAPTKVGYFTP